MGRLRRGGDFELADEPLALDRVRRALVVVVEADFAAGDHLRLGEQAVELGEGRVVGLGRVVRIDAGAGEEAGHAGLAVELAANFERLVHLRRPFADADGEHRAHAGFRRRAPAWPRGRRRSARCRGGRGNR